MVCVFDRCSGSLACLQPMGVKFVEIPTDLLGLVPDKLAAILDSWDVTKVMYLVVS